MIVYSIKMLNGKPLIDGRLRIRRRSDKYKRLHDGICSRRMRQKNPCKVVSVKLIKN